MKYIRLIFYFSLLVVFILSTVNADVIPRFNSLSMLSDKLVHLSIYAYHCFVGCICKFKISILNFAIYIFLFGAFIELIHYFHPNRYFEYFDLLANLFGVTIALLINKLKKLNCLLIYIF